MFVAPLSRCVRARVLPGSAVDMRIVFAGTPEPALPSLRRLIDSPRHDVVAVLTRPDAASGRRGKPSPSPVARLARERDIPVLRPPRPNSDEFVAELTDLAPDAVPSSPTAHCCATRCSAYPATAGSTCTSRCCPRGGVPRPVQAAIAAGDAVTGATTFRIEAGPGLRARLRRRHRDRPARPTPRAICWTGCRCRVRRCWRRRWTASPTAR